MTHGPIDFIMVAFDDAHITSDVALGIKSLIDSETISIIDLLFVEKNKAGDIKVVELDDLSDSVYESWNAVVGDLEGMLTTEDATTLTADLPVDRSAVIALYENVWARKLSQSISEARGEVLAAFRIPRSVISELEA